MEAVGDLIVSFGGVSFGTPGSARLRVKFLPKAYETRACWIKNAEDRKDALTGCHSGHCLTHDHHISFVHLQALPAKH